MSMASSGSSNVASGGGGGDASVTKELTLLLLQALLRLGRVKEALDLSDSALPMQSPSAALAFARLHRICGAVAVGEGEGAGAGAGAAGPPAQLTLAPGAYSTLVLPSELMVAPSAALPIASLAPAPVGALRQQAGRPSAAIALLRLALRCGGAFAPPSQRALLWPALLQATVEEAAAAGVGTLKAAGQVLGECLSDALGPAGEAATRGAYLRHCAGVAVRVGGEAVEPRHLQLALGSAAPAGVHCTALRALLRGFRGGARSLPAATLRALFDASLGGSHGQHSSQLWLLYLEFEGCAGAQLQPPPGVHARALRALKGAAAVAFVEGAALLGVSSGR